MSLFQKSVINKYLKNLDNEKVNKAFENFQKFYGNKLRLHNIMQLKEENYQEGFLREIFVQTLGYTINPDENYNLTTEYKNQKDARKADGAILQDGKAIGVIELKSTKTKDLESIKEQAFSYKNNQPGCRYVITSNFQSLRFYIDDATEYEEFNLFQLAGGVKTDGLTRQFKLFFLLLSKESIFNDLPAKLKEETKFHENDISAQLYDDYKRFKNKIFKNLVKNNPQYNKLTLFKKSQKLLDRFLFVFFAEDSGLIPPNAISEIIKQWKQLQELDEYKTLYSRFQKLFSHLNKGHTYKKWGEIPAYNGGLFRNDELLDSTELKIDDEVLEKDSLTLSAYDFNTEVDVNILGHIFEHSLNETEEITAKLTVTAETTEHVPLKKTSKRKKDGIFYTPKYITKYIVENTVGTLCKEKKDELQISNLLIDKTYHRTATTRGHVHLTEKGKKLYKTLNNYKDWLLTLKILDPACGSGAFLNATLDFLIAEHKQTDDLIAELTGDALGLFDTDKAILENNIFGVDINEESVEIAKLSMWLRTAQKGRPLSDLSGNIKCGNSLIDDPEVAGDKAFDWNREFPQIFKKKDKKAWHITFALHNSRYAYGTDGLTRRFEQQPGFITKTYPELSEEEEIILAEELATVATEYNLNIPECNICADHVHAIIVCEKTELSKLTGKWKGRTAYLYNRRVNPLIDDQKAKYSDGTKEKFWAKSFYPVLINNNEQFNNTVNYIKNNREKHQLSPATDGLTRQLETMACTTEHAFRTEYTGGFDVVIGNPPYVMTSISIIEKKYYKKHYYLNEGKPDLYRLFIERSYSILKKFGKFSFIIPNSLLTIPSCRKIRNYLLINGGIERICNFWGDVFGNVGVNSVIIGATKDGTQSQVELINDKETLPSGETLYYAINNSKLIDKNYFLDDKEHIINVNISIGSLSLLKKIEKLSVKLYTVSEYTLGMQVYHNTMHSEDIIKNREYHSLYKKDNTYYPESGGSNIKRYVFLESYKEYVSYGEWCYNKPDWEFCSGDRLLIREIPYNNKLVCTYTDLTHISNKAVIIVKSEIICIKFLLAILNSSLLGFHSFITTEKGSQRLFPRISLTTVKNLPVKNIPLNKQKPISEKADIMLSLNKKLQTEKNNFLNTLKEDKGIKKITQKLNTFYEFEYEIFKKELSKQKVKFALGNENNEWREYFNTTKQKINDFQNQINQTDKEIDKMVYKLYKLTEEEIEIVEESVK